MGYGMTEQFYSAAQYGVLCANIANEKGMSHKKQLQALIWSAWLILPDEWQNVFDDISKVPLEPRFDSTEDCEKIKIPQEIARLTMHRDLMPAEKISSKQKPHPTRIRPLPWPKAEEMFLEKYQGITAMLPQSERQTQ